MERYLGRFAPHAYALLRIVAGLMFAMHGSQKLFGWPGGSEPVPVTLMKVAGFIELVTGIFIAIGLLTPLMAFLASGQMAVAYFKAHAPNGIYPVLNQGELAALYAFLFLYIACAGDGIWSVGRRGGSVDVRTNFRKR
ncbi:MAG TPA: DoxX family protein [Thermoanaerobaculia bacterium]|jgi:putative oxidoreductase